MGAGIYPGDHVGVWKELLRLPDDNRSSLSILNGRAIAVNVAPA